jgi:uncharacterized membrane protein (UPF0127 family)
MLHAIARLAPVVAAAVFCWMPVAVAAAGPAMVELGIESGTGVHHRFAVEIADNEERRRTGLMFRDNLGANAGMLFDFGHEDQVSMWMGNTFIPLDMLFIAADGEIVRIARRTQPLSPDHIYSLAPVRAVLEINAGTADRLGIHVGDRVIYPRFEATSVAGAR